MSNSNDSDLASAGLPNGWTLVRVAEAGAVRLGRQRSPDQMSGEFQTRYVRAANITPAGLNIDDLFEMNFTPVERETFALAKGDVLLTEASGSASQVGRAAIWQGEVHPCCYQNTVIRFRPHLVTAEYALLVFRHMAATGVFARAARGVGIQHLGASRFGELDLPLPPLDEQRRIVKIADQRLNVISEARVRLKSALGHLQEQTREILAAATAGELITQEPSIFSVNEGAPSSVSFNQANLFEENDAKIDLEYFDQTLPPSWRWARIDQVGQVTLGRQRSPQYERGYHMRPYLRVANVYEDRIDTSDVLQMNFEPEEATTYKLHDGDILLNEGQSPELVGRPAIYHEEVPGACFQNTLIRFRAGDGVEPEYALLVFRHYLHSGVFRRTARWSTNIAHLGLERFRVLPFPVPPLEEQAGIVAEARRRLKAVNQQTDAVLASMKHLPELTRELFAAAIAGELTAQDPSDESGAALKSRLGAPVQNMPTEPHKGTQKLSMSKHKPRPSQQAEPMPDLTAVLRQNSGTLPLPDLFASAGYNRDWPEHVELFYLALRSALSQSLLAVESGTTENADVKIANATR